MAAEIVPFHVEHLNILSLRDYEKNSIMKLPNIYKYFEILGNNPKGSAGTLIDDGRIITCMGYAEVWDGVAEIWQIPSIYVSTKPLIFCKTIKGFVESLAETHKWHRIQTVSINDELHNRWMRWLKFEKEGILKQYSFDKEDYIQWRRLFKWDN